MRLNSRLYGYNKAWTTNITVGVKNEHLKEVDSGFT